MRLDRLDLTRYGHFTEKSLAFPRPLKGGSDIHVIYGPNEAGKSTLFSAWLDLLFGLGHKTRYDFLHQSTVLEIGACVSQGEMSQELRRQKRRGDALFAKDGTPLPESTLSALLGGLSRETYVSMFSLDDETIEKGGDTILQSKGELGRMLFSASAGLADLIPQIEHLQQERARFHNGKRSGWIFEAAAELKSLDAQRNALEVTHVQLQKLRKDHDAAEYARKEANLALQNAQSHHDALLKMQTSAPLQQRLQVLEKDLQSLEAYSDITEQMLERVFELEEKKTNLNTRRTNRSVQIQNLKSRQTAIAPDRALLKISAKIADAETGSAKYISALADLPTREARFAELKEKMQVLLLSLGAQDKPADFVAIERQRLTILRQLLTERAEVLTRAQQAQIEYEAALSKHAKLQASQKDLGPAQSEAALLVLLAELRQTDPRAQLTQNTRLLIETEQALARSLETLLPWSDSIEMLRALPVPSKTRLMQWQTALSQAQEAELQAAQSFQNAQDESARLTEQLEAQTLLATETVSLAQTARARSLREDLWAQHLSTLTPQSAALFEQALREDDRLSGLWARTLAQSQNRASLEAQLASLALRQEGCRQTHLAAIDQLQAIEAEIALISQALGLEDKSLNSLSNWIALRAIVLEKADLCESQRLAQTLAAQTLEEAARALQDILQIEGPARHFDALWAEAQARVSAGDLRREARKQMEEAEDALAERLATVTKAREALSVWRLQWRDAVQGSILETISEESPHIAGHIDTLDTLRLILDETADLEHRIRAMQRDRDLTLAARRAILTELGAEVDWSSLLQDVRKAQENARLYDALEQELTATLQEEAADLHALEQLKIDQVKLGQAFGWSEYFGDLAQYAKECRKATELREERLELLKNLADIPSTSKTETELSADLAQAKQDLDLHQETAQRSFAALKEAQRQLDAVGSDDALLRIAAQRQTLLLQIEDETKKDLAHRLGLAALEVGIQRYREGHRSSMLARASDAFSRLSGGAYTGLAAQPDGTQEVLVALARNGASKTAPQLSKGARFQLYLALRIAGYYEIAQNQPSVPFIADDILETFDDTRAAATFELLGEMSQRGQVIYLTHHRHLCEIARHSCPGVNIIEL